MIEHQICPKCKSNDIRVDDRINLICNDCRLSFTYSDLIRTLNGTFDERELPTKRYNENLCQICQINEVDSSCKLKLEWKEKEDRGYFYTCISCWDKMRLVRDIDV